MSMHLTQVEAKRASDRSEKRGKTEKSIVKWLKASVRFVTPI